MGQRGLVDLQPAALIQNYPGSAAEKKILAWRADPLLHHRIALAVTALRSHLARPQQLAELNGVVTEPERVTQIEADCKSAAIGCGDCKKLLAESLEVELTPIRLRGQALREHPERVRDALSDEIGAARVVVDLSCRRSTGDGGVGWVGWRSWRSWGPWGCWRGRWAGG